MAVVVPSLRYETLCLRRPGLVRDLPLDGGELQWVSNTATLVLGERDAVLIDTFLTIEQNQRLAEWVQRHDRNLAHVFITHGHGDHTFGVKQLLGAFPEARAVAGSATVAKARSEGTPPRIDTFWSARFPGQVPQKQVFPDSLDDATFTVEGHTFQVIETGFTDTEGSTALWVPDLRLVAAGDVAYNGIHPFTGETTTSSREEWMRATDRLAALAPAHVVAGHKNPELADDSGILAETKQYLADFDRLAIETDTPTELYAAMLSLYPDWANPGSLWAGAKRAKGVR
ncbi:MBL fold metallo-hydrolase [Streptomyces sp. NPDC001822]|uniref:MBL fold metallo-hydrolase n=1 Tax=Streptomyces sp. NPDC001822 TaxID=3364614 RepID=UPI00369E5D06